MEIILESLQLDIADFKLWICFLATSTIKETTCTHL
jgi:hypothetical protein